MRCIVAMREVNNGDVKFVALAGCNSRQLR